MTNPKALSLPTVDYSRESGDQYRVHSRMTNPKALSLPTVDYSRESGDQYRVHYTNVDWP